MTADWNFRPLGAVCEVLDHLRKPVTKKDRLPGPYPYYGATGVVDYVSDFLFDEPLILVGEDGAKWGAGDTTAFAITGPCWVNNHAHVIRPDRANVLDEWLVHYLVHLDLSRYVSGLTVPKLNQGSLREIPIPVPALSEQRRIVAILDEAFEGIATAKAHAEKNLRNAREVFDTYLAITFAGAGVGWSVGPVGAVADCCLGKMLDKAKNKGDAKPYLRNLNVRWFEFDLTDVQEMRFTPEEYERYSVRRGDVVICEGGYPGRAAVWEEDRPIFIQKALHRVRFKDAILGRWFLYYLYSQEASGALQQYFTGTGIQHFTGAALSRLPFPLAPSAVTAALVERFDALARSVSNLEAIYQSKVTALEELKKSLLHQAFSGQL